MLIVLCLLGFTGIMGGYSAILETMFFCCLILFLGGLLRETARKIE
jgi:uncharacterized membrane protein YtjA (UPF0391 family)